MKLRTLSSHAKAVKVSNKSNESQPDPWDQPTNPIDRAHIDYFEYNKNTFFNYGRQLQ